MKWTPVTERLPENRKSVLTTDGKHQSICSYTKGHEIEYEDYDYDGEYDPVEEKAGCLYLKPGWYECEETPGGEFDEVWVGRKVTHWMLLPPTPDQSTSLSTSVEEEFKEYMNESRNLFVFEINKQDWNNKLRTSAEDFLICFDQMMERLLSSDFPSSSVTGDEGWEAKWNKLYEQFKKLDEYNVNLREENKRYRKEVDRLSVTGDSEEVERRTRIIEKLVKDDSMYHVHVQESYKEHRWQQFKKENNL